jgi:nucleotide-binding universal stress UspA family protein
MTTFRRILWPTDFSRLSRRALPVVKDVASRFSAAVEVLHVLQPLPAMGFMTGQGAVAATEYMKTSDDGAQKTLREIVDRDLAGGIEARGTTTTGNAAHEIVRFAEGNEIDLIIIATHGETGFSRWVFGSVAEKVVRLASCPVLTVPAPPDEE